MNWDDANVTAAKMRELDVTTPNVARIYDFLLGGKDNYHADRVAAAQLACALPHCPEAARENRAFLGRVVRHLAGNGIRQFLDIGSGLPAAANTHQAAQQVHPGASAPAVPRGLGDVERFFTGLNLIPPAVADIRTWHRTNPDLTAPLAFYGGVGIVPGTEG